MTPEGACRQVPVPVDEPAIVDFGSVPASSTTPGTVGTVYGGAPIGVRALQYTDAGTFTGPIRTPPFDADDELVFTASDLAPTWAPTAGPSPSAPAYAGRHAVRLRPLGQHREPLVASGG